MTGPSSHFEPDCSRCFALCCIALQFQRAEGFGHDKAAGTPCHFLQSDYRCAIHTRREHLGYDGCIDFSCLGAGQRASAQFAGMNWQQNPTTARMLYARFAQIMQIQELKQALLEVEEQGHQYDDTERMMVLGLLDRLAESADGCDFQGVVSRAKLFIDTLG